MRWSNKKSERWRLAPTTTFKHHKSIHKQTWTQVHYTEKIILTTLPVTNIYTFRHVFLAIDQHCSQTSTLQCAVWSCQRMPSIEMSDQSKQTKTIICPSEINQYKPKQSPVLQSSTLELEETVLHKVFLPWQTLPVPTGKEIWKRANNELPSVISLKQRDNIQASTIK